MPVNDQMIKATVDSMFQAKLNEHFACKIDSIVAAATSIAKGSEDVSINAIGNIFENALIPIVALMIPVFISFVAALVIYFYLKYRNREKMEMIKMGINPYEKTLKPLPQVGTKSLFWGLIFLFVGVAGVIHSIINGTIFNSHHTGYFICLGIGAACFLYWKLTEKHRKIAEDYYKSIIGKNEEPVTDRELKNDINEEI